MELVNRLAILGFNEKEKEIATLVLKSLRGNSKTLPNIFDYIKSSTKRNYYIDEILGTIITLRENNVIYLNLDDKKFYLPPKLKFPYQIFVN